MNKLLTIIVPIYNTQEFLPKCLDSLIINENLMPQVEVLLIIDGSPDNSIEIAQKYAEKYPQTFVVVDKENGGYGSVLQRGIQDASGKYCKVLDSDDWYDTADFEQLVQLLQTSDYDIIATDYVREYVFENRQELMSLPLLKNNHRYDLDKDILQLQGDIFMMHRLAYKTEIVRKANISFPTKISYTDTLFATIPMFFAKDLYYTNLRVYRYFIGRDGQTINPATIRKNRKQTQQVTQYLYDKYLEHKDELSQKKNEYILSSLKSYMELYFRILHHLPFSDAKKELAEWNQYIKNTPYHKYFTSSKMWKYYNLLPYRVFRYTSFLWNK
ncbi:glycosyltransferase family 2 protein [Bergeyella porcorum]